MSEIRILLLADTHIGFDLPVQPRVRRRRRGYDFLANYSAALEPARTGEVDIVVHAGDVFDRPSVVSSIAYQGYEPLRRVAELGVPVFIVPGNHERSRLPHARFASHSNIHVFDRPRSFAVGVRGARIGLSGFPYERHDVRARFTGLVDDTGWRATSADIHLLCVHHCVEGATVGPGNFTFTTAEDVIRTREIPREFAAVLSGHIHRHQVLMRDLEGRRPPAPVLYPGSVERTSFAEIDEPKGFIVIHVSTSEGDVDVRWEFRPLPARPMCRHTIASHDMSARALESAVRDIIVSAPRAAVLSIRIDGALLDEHVRAISAQSLRGFVPETMNLEIRPAAGFPAAVRRHPDLVALAGA